MNRPRQLQTFDLGSLHLYSLDNKLLHAIYAEILKYRTVRTATHCFVDNRSLEFGIDKGPPEAVYAE